MARFERPNRIKVAAETLEPSTLKVLVAKSRNVRLLSVAMQLKQQVGELIKQCLQAKIDRAKKTYQHMLEEMKGVPEPTTASGNQLGLHELGH